MTADEYVPSEFMVRGAYNYARGSGPDSDATLDAEFDRFLARVRRDAWDACYHQMVTAPARGVTVTKKSNPYAPERRVTP